MKALNPVSALLSTLFLIFILAISLMTRADPAQAGSPPQEQVITVSFAEEREITLRRRGTLIEIVNSETAVPLAQYPLASIAQLIIVGMANQDDTLTVDFSNGSPIPPDGLHFDGGIGGFDSLVVVGDEGDVTT